MKSRNSLTIVQLNDSYAYFDLHQEMFWQGGRAVDRSWQFRKESKDVGIDWIVTLWSALVVLVATTVHGITGFGTDQITMGALPFRDALSASIVVSILVLSRICVSLGAYETSLIGKTGLFL